MKAISLAVASCFSVAAESAFANPTGPTVVSGSAIMNRQGNVLSVTNSPGAIINWRAFSIGSNEVTRFVQQSAASSVLNRVVGADPSVVLGALQSNGRVFLINPNGVLFGAGAQIDVAGLVASTLNLSNADFAAGRLRFTDTPGAGNINNQGTITTPSGGQVYLIAPNVQNSGIITSPKGEVILAAGRTVELVDAATPNLRIEITAPDTEAVNIGQIVANSGKIGIYAGLVKNSGEIRADGVVVGQNGEILLKATNSVALDKGSVVSASGPSAGKVTIQADNGTVVVAGTVAANATQGAGGSIAIAGAQGVSVEPTAQISANGLHGGTTSIASSTGSVTIAAPVSANAIAGRAGRIAINAAMTAVLKTGAELSANGVQGGTIAISGAGGVTLEGGSVVQASGVAGGTVNVQAEEGAINAQGTIDLSGTDDKGGVVGINANGDITLDATSRILARGRAGGEVRVEATRGTLLASGLIDGQSSNGPGGKVWLLAPRVALIRRAVIDVSGDTAGGEVLIGGDYQGRNPLVRNASRTYFGPDAVIRADAITSGNGGKVIVWSDDGTQAYGAISARGGAQAGNGGFVETSGKTWLDFFATVDTSAPHGAFGTLLLDPKDIDVNDSGGSAYSAGVNNLFANNASGTTVILATGAGSISAQSSNVLLQANNDITFTSAVNIANAGTTLTAQAGRSIIVNANITTNNADITLTANETTANGVSAADRSAGAGGVTMAAGTTIDAGNGNVFLQVADGSGHSGATTPSSIALEMLNASNISVINNNLNSGSSIVSASGISLLTASTALIMTATSIGAAGNAINIKGGPNTVTATATNGDIFLQVVAGDLSTSNYTLSAAAAGKTISLAAAGGASVFVDSTAGFNANTADDNFVLTAENIGFVGATTLTAASATLLAPLGTITSGTAAVDIDTSAANGAVSLFSSGGAIGSIVNPLAVKTGTGVVSATTSGAGATGDISISAPATLRLGTLSTDAGSSQTVTISTTGAGSDLLLAAPTTLNDVITLSAGRDLDLNGQVLTTGAGASATFTGGGDVLLRGGITEAAGGLNLTVNAANVVRTPAASTFTLNGATNATLLVNNGKVWNNDGTVNLQGISTIRLPNVGGYAAFSNNAGGILNISSTAGWSFLSDAAVQGGILVNSGVFNVSTFTSWEAAFANLPTGALNVAPGGGISMQNGQSLSGTVSLGSGATLWVSEWHGTNAGFNGTTIMGTGTVLVQAGLGPIADFTNVNAPGITLKITPGGTANLIGGASTFGALNIPGGTFVLNNTTFVQASGDLTIPTSATYVGTNGYTASAGNLIFSGGTVIGGTGLTLAGAGSAQFSGGVVNLNLPVTANLAVAVAGGTANFNGAANTFNNGGSLTAGTLNLSGTTTLAAGLFDVSGGTLNASAGTVNVGGILHSGGGVINAGTLNIVPGGTLYGIGTVTANVNNDGFVKPGNSPGALTIAGNYTQGPGGVLDVELGGTLAGAQYDVLNVTGNASLAGGLNVALFGGFTGAGGDVFNLINTGGVLSGAFGSTAVPAGYVFTPAYSPVLFSLTLNTVGVSATALNQVNSVATNDVLRGLDLLNRNVFGTRPDSDLDDFSDVLMCRPR